MRSRYFLMVSTQRFTSIWSKLCSSPPFMPLATMFRKASTRTLARSMTSSFSWRNVSAPEVPAVAATEEEEEEGGVDADVVDVDVITVVIVVVLLAVVVIVVGVCGGGDGARYRPAV